MSEATLATLECFDLFFNHAFDLLAIVNASGYFILVNPAFERVLGFTPHELYAEPLTSFMHPDDVGKTRAGIANLAAGISTLASKNRYRCKTGEYKWFSWNSIPVGSLFYTVGRDITDQVRSEERIQDLYRQIQLENEVLEMRIQERVDELKRSEAQVLHLQKMDAIGRLAGGIAHDFNNMLSAISLYCDLIGDCVDPTSTKGRVQNIRKVCERAAALTRQLLIFGHKQIFQQQAVDLNPLILQMEAMLTRLIGEKIRFITKLDEKLNEVRVDPSQLEQILLNLVVNARDALPMGGTIVVETQNIYLDEKFTSKHLSINPGHYVLLSVSDDGHGMDTETLSRIFEPFFTTKPIGKGTGLGLATTYGIVKQINGTIWVYSEVGKGSVFKIYVPAAEKAVEDRSVVPTKSLAAQCEHSILLVEDDERLREGFAAILRKKGFKVLATANGEEALEVCRTHQEPVHLLLTDVVMPSMNGIELAHQLRTLRKDLRVLYMSGYTNDALERSGRADISEREFIQKPFSTSMLIEKLLQILS